MANRDPEREKQWHALLTQWQEAEQTISAFCNQRPLSKPSFNYWQRKLGFGRRATSLAAATFVPMKLVTEPWVEVVLPTGVTLNPWFYLRDVLDQLAARSAGAEVGDLLPDTWAKRQWPIRCTRDALPSHMPSCKLYHSQDGYSAAVTSACPTIVT